MSKTEFERLSQEEQLHLLQTSGIYNGKLKKGTQTGILYQLDSFYIEVIYQEYRRMVSQVNCFESTGPIDPYLEQNDLAF